MVGLVVHGFVSLWLAGVVGWWICYVLVGVALVVVLCLVIVC